ncbi:MAG TPA: thioredoxin family protein [Streptosporangiaceae bacterium]|nr:thioredoxin family protein [Streptosporangiaceae bacterium]
MDVTVLAVAGCPHAALLEERLAAALVGGPPPVIIRRVIADLDEAARAGLRGSPTVLFDGWDPFAAPGQPASMSCRLYDNGAGRLEGAPSVGRLREAIAAQEPAGRRARRTGSSGGAASGAPR